LKMCYFERRHTH